MSYSTPQERFWAGEFGTDYISRNQSERLLAANLAFFAEVLKATGKLASCVELGANVGMNLRALKLLVPDLELRAVEINREAVRKLRSTIPPPNVIHGSLLECSPEPAELAFTKGVLIHINPDALPTAYDKLYSASTRFILVAEYYNPVPVTISYRGHDDRLFKRDFAGEMMERFPDLTVRSSGFLSKHDPIFPQDDLTWFMMEKR